MKHFVEVCAWLRKYDCLPNTKRHRRAEVRYWLDVSVSHLYDEVKSGKYGMSNS